VASDFWSANDPTCNYRVNNWTCKWLTVLTVRTVSRYVCAANLWNGVELATVNSVLFSEEHPYLQTNARQWTEMNWQFILSFEATCSRLCNPHEVLAIRRRLDNERWRRIRIRRDGLFEVQACWRTTFAKLARNCPHFMCIYVFSILISQVFNLEQPWIDDPQTWRWNQSLSRLQYNK
jgi:hypothetical protein